MTSTVDVELTVDDLRKARRAIEHCFESGWTDGMPVVPPIPEFVEEVLSSTKRDPEEVLCAAPHLNRECTVRDAAANAVMAGCKPEYFPLFVAVMQAFAQIGPVMAQSTTGRAFAIVVNGPIRHKLGINCTGNILGPGDRPNSTIGRALRLVLMNVFDIRPHDLDQSTHGTPGKYSLCIGENEEESPWEPLHVEYGFPGDASTVLIQQTRSTLHVDHRTTQVPEQILYTIARSMSYLGHATASASAGGRITNTEGVYHRNLGCVVVLGPEHAGHIGSKGWSKADVRRYLFERWGNTAGELRRAGEPPEIAGLPDDAFIGASAGPDSLKIIVAGANNAGESTILPGYGRHAGPVLIEDV
ncbi:MAG: hypothetical protein ACRDJE_17830 [Dehalococcoidia bacterium]